MTDTNDTDTDDGTRMRDVSHTSPYTGKSAGNLFARGRTVVADGGRDEGRDADEEPATMKDVSHTPPHDADDVNRVFERGEAGEDTEE
ncbi:hypothetical protein [Saliphagus infecundisoli]|uniref:Uncharacterized protein n=1 Tax=Saliphagus infecundisoli TaxID=1849069 RepID=A0ABD5QJK9_9EURY|nr:hypothetical protein [Saliphagus infecundisoli]